MILHIINFSGPLGGLKIGQYHIKWTTYSKFQSLKEGLLTNWNLIKRSRFLPRKKLLDLCFKVIVPSLAYALLIWGYATNKNEFYCYGIYTLQSFSPPQRLPLGIPVKIAIHRAPRAFFFFLPAFL